MKPSATAIHEAGHAVIAHIMGAKVMRIKIGPGPDRGMCYTAVDDTILKDFPRIKKQDPVLITVINIAGYCADLLWNDRVPGNLPYEDYRNWSQRGVGKWGFWIVKDFVDQVLRKNKNIVMHVARSLDERGSLTRRQFLYVVRGGV